MHALLAALAVAIPAPTGQYAVGTTTITVREGLRVVPVQLWYPSSARGRTAYMPKAVANAVGHPGAAGLSVPAAQDARVLPRGRGWPVVIFSPGFGESRQLYTGELVDLASHGFAVAAIDHPGQEEAVAYPNGHTLVQALPKVAGTFEQLVAIRAADARAVIARLAHEPGLDTTRLGMFGHSLGGATAARLLVTDPRIRAAADLDGSIGDLPRGDWSKPFALLETPTTLSKSGGCKLDATRHLECRHDVLDYVQHLTGPREVLAFAGATHMSFSDEDFLSHGGKTLAAERAYLAWFFGRYLAGRTLPAPRVGGVTSVRVP